MKTGKQIREKIKQLEEYLEKGVPMCSSYPLENTELFLAGLKWVLEEEVKKQQEKK